MYTFFVFRWLCEFRYPSSFGAYFARVRGKESKNLMTCLSSAWSQHKIESCKMCVHGCMLQSP
eukprot:1772933-Amphidinium_carterae.1